MSNLKQAEDTVSELLSVNGGKSIEHYGVKGMRWGVRRKVGSDGRVKGKGGVKKRVQDYTDDELRSVLNRMDMERRFSQMTKAEPTLMQKAQADLGSILRNTAKQQATNLVNAYATKGLEKLTGLNLQQKKKK